jgi:hypothetical protein
MAHEDYVESRHIVWQMKIPEIALDMYLNYVRVLPSWKQSFPAYVHPLIRGVVELAPNKTQIVTETSEYVFVFDERTTFVPDAAELVRTGFLEVLYNDALVLRLSISPPDSDERGKSWVARGIEEFKDGEWIAELTQLVRQLASHEIEQEKKEEALRQNELQDVAELKEKLSTLLPGTTEKTPWFQQAVGALRNWRLDKW